MNGRQPPLSCGSCGRAVPAEASFCPTCGRSLAVDCLPETHAVPVEPTPFGGSGSLGGRQLSSGFAPGTLFAGRYRIVSLLGKGGMGVVYRAEDLKLGQQIALKFLPDELAHHPVRLAALLAEVRNARQVSHPNVCRVHDVGEHEGRHFLSMEYVDGEDLASLLRRIGRLPVTKALELAQQLCAGLAAAHARGLIHRDIKPGNVMIDGTGQARLTDFGLATPSSSVIQGEVAGTLLYMAPEQMDGSGGSVASDLYSLGLVIYESLSGRRPFAASTAGELFQKRKAAAPAPALYSEGVDAGVELAILRCLEPDPRMRPASALEVGAALPGGDPLAALLAAGHTPSPQMVAAAGSEGSLRPPVAWAWLGAFVALVALCVLMSVRGSLFGAAHPEKSPDVLTERAQQIIERAGYGGGKPDHAHWLDADIGARPKVEAAKGDRGPDDDASSVSFGFRYRSSPRPLVSVNPLRDILEYNPPLDLPGMANVTLDARGRLLRFEAVPRVEAKTETSQELDWSVFFREAGFDAGEFVAFEPESTPIRAFDSHRAWRRVTPDALSTGAFVEGVAFRGQAVFFDVQSEEPKSAERAGTDSLATARGTAHFAFLSVFFALSVVLARRNVRLGRSDLRGAWRLVAFLFVGGLFFRMLTVHHAYGGPWQLLSMVRTNAAAILWGATFLGLMYLALEPFARRSFPSLLIGWSKVLAGRFRDPRVGAEILPGAALGALCAVFFFAPSFLPPSAGVPGAANTSVSVLLGLRHQLSEVFDATVFGVWGAVGSTVALAVGFALTRRRWPGLIVVGLIFVPILTRFCSLHVPPTVRLSVGALTALVLVVTLLRFGTLAVATEGTVLSLLLSQPIDVTASTAYVGSSWLALVAVVAVGLYGFVTALGGQPLLGRAIDR